MISSMKHITRKQAKAKGLKFYFTGLPCRNGHIAERKLEKSECLECIRMYNRERRYVRKERNPFTQSEIRREATKQAAAKRRAERAVLKAIKEERRLEREMDRARSAAERENEQRDKAYATYPTMTRVAFDVVLMRPGSPRIQELMTCAKDAGRFFTESSFIDEMTPHMRVYPLDKATYIRISNKVRLAYPDEEERLRREEREVGKLRKREWNARNRDRRNARDRARVTEEYAYA